MPAKRAIRYRIDGDVAYVTLTRGYVTKLDAADLPLVMGHSWCALFNSQDFYATTNVTLQNGTRRHTLLHRLITGALKGTVVDHINHDTLDNRRANLRVVSHQDNSRNRRGAQRNSSMGIRGIFYRTPKRADPYYTAYVGLGRSPDGRLLFYRKRFPGTTKGLVDAVIHVHEKRAELFGQLVLSDSSGGPTVPVTS